jgi:hypothetical protein
MINFKRKLLSLLLSAALVLALLPVVTLPAKAAGFDHEYNINSGSVTIRTAGNYRIYGTGTPVSNNILIDRNVSGIVSITLDNVSIDMTALGSGSMDAFGMLCLTNTNVRLTLVGTNTIKGGGAGCAAITVRSSSTLTFTEQSTGSLTAIGGDAAGLSGAGIGAGSYMSNPDHGTIIINGGTITATGGTNSAGIGGSLYYNAFSGAGYATNSSSGNIIINGGTVTATGGTYGAGIGSGGGYLPSDGDSGTVIITGGTVTATGGNGAADGSILGGAGIGGGSAGSCGSVFISGGTVTASGGRGSAGIGGGALSTATDCASPGLVQISGGTVTANGSDGGAGIGGGLYTAGGMVTISGGVVIASGSTDSWGYGGAGIGSGGGCDNYGGMNGGSVKVTGGMVTATGGRRAAGIGGGGNKETTTTTNLGGYAGLLLFRGAYGGDVTISGGTVIADGGIGGVGIGGGRNASNETVGDGVQYISGGSVNASIPAVVYSSEASAVPLYKTVVTGLPAGAAVTYSANGGASASCIADGTGNLYLWLPESAGTSLDITAGSAAYTASGAVSSTVENTFTASEVVYTSSGGGAYSLAAVASSAYNTGAAAGNLPTMTVKAGVTGFKYFEVSIRALAGHTGTETAVFVLTRGGQQIALNAATADFDIAGSAKAGFNVKAGDVITVYLVDSLSNDGGTSPTVL